MSSLYIKGCVYLTTAALLFRFYNLGWFSGKVDTQGTIVSIAMCFAFVLASIGITPMKVNKTFAAYFFATVFYIMAIGVIVCTIDLM